MGNRNTLSAQVREESALYEGFQEYRDRHGFESKSEAVRSALRDGIEADVAEQHAGPWSALSKVAGDELPLQLRLLGYFMTFTAVALWAFQTGLLGGYAWAVGAAFFGFLTVTTFVGVLTGLAELLNPSGVSSSAPADDADEVDA